MKKNNLYKLRAQIISHNLNGFIVPSTDFFQNENVPKHLNRLKFLTGFTGSNGVAIVTKDKAAFFTDSRYLLQASKELSDDYAILDMNAKSSCDWFDVGLSKGDKLGYDGCLHTRHNLDYYEKLALKYGFKLKQVQTNLIDKFWIRSEEKIEPAFKLDLKFAGKSYQDKLNDVIKLIDGKAKYLFITNPDAVCWLLNIRGHDVDYTPLLLSYCIIGKDRSVKLFTNKAKINFILDNTVVYDLSNLDTKLKKLIKESKVRVQLDHAMVPVKYCNLLEKVAINLPSPIEGLKAVKNLIEIKGFRNAHIVDGLAITQFIFWLNHHKSKINESEAAEKLLEFRNISKEFIYPSFATISAYGSNGAIIHYKPSKKDSAVIGNKNFYLLDSGGQYYSGTTDVTRTLHLGKPNKQQKKLYTLVLKGHIGLAKVRFPKGTCGAHLDALARHNLWSKGLNYAHGTGHGVGHFLSIHEGPQRISNSLSAGGVMLQAGMILSNEPGYYVNGKFGIRLENLMLVKDSKFKNFLEFETITLVPFQHNLINYNLLNTDEIKWLNNYQHKVLATHQRFLNDKEIKWLKSYMGI